jgi:predicted nucleotidyltransferase
MVIDLVPFGGVEDANSIIAWPPDRDIVMHVAGFSDALESAVQVTRDDSLTIPVTNFNFRRLPKNPLVAEWHLLTTASR